MMNGGTRGRLAAVAVSAHCVAENGNTGDSYGHPGRGADTAVENGLPLAHVSDFAELRRQ
jgi:hypothetical protein